MDLFLRHRKQWQFLLELWFSQTFRRLDLLLRNKKQRKILFKLRSTESVGGNLWQIYTD